MNTATMARRDAVSTEAAIPSAVAAAAFPDPLGADDAADEIVLTTRRAIGRVALVAVETAGRFQREGIRYDPMAWMLAPRRAFDGAAAIDAALDRDDCERGILVHGLGLDLDIDRAAVDVLMAEDEGDGCGDNEGEGPEDGFDPHDLHHPYGDEVGRDARRGGAVRATRLRLYTATIIDTRDNRMTQAFHASVARDMPEVRARLAGRFGPDLADAADIRLGVHLTSPAVMALVPAPVIDLVRRTQRDIFLPAARTFAVDIELIIQA